MLHKTVTTVSGKRRG